jgi:hypothetical protein
MLAFPISQTVTIEDPGSYTVTFADDGTVAVQADCNQDSGEYMADLDEVVTIMLGPVTAAACPEGSRSDAFLRYLGAATGFTFEGERLDVLLNPDSGILVLGFDPCRINGGVDRAIRT